MDEQSQMPPWHDAVRATAQTLLDEGAPLAEDSVLRARDDLRARFLGTDADALEQALWLELTQRLPPTAPSVPLPVKAPRPVASAPFRAGDLRASAALEAATRQLQRWILTVRWHDPDEALIAATVTAVLRLDLDPTPKAVAAWLATPWATVVRTNLDQAPTHSLLHLDTLTFLSLRRLHEAQAQPSDTLGAGWCARHAAASSEATAPCPDDLQSRQRETAARRLLGQCEAIMAPWLPTGHQTLRGLRHWLAAWRRVHWSPLMHTLATPDATRPLAPHSALRWALGSAPPGRPEPEGSGPHAWALADSVDGYDHWLSPLAADRLLLALQKKLRKKGKDDSYLLPAQARAAVQQCRQAHPWGLLEQLLLAWIQDKLGGASPYQASSAVRYLGGLRKLVQAQGRTPLVTRDPGNGQLQPNVHQWNLALATVAHDGNDRHALTHIGQFFQSLTILMPTLEDVDEEVWETLREASQPAAHVVAPSEFETAIDPLWHAGGDGERAALAAALGFYLGLRHQEVLKLLSADLLDLDTGLLQIRRHRSRRLKTGNARRRILVQPWLPAYWWDRLREQAQRMQATPRERGRPVYLFAEPHAPHLAPPDLLAEIAVACLRTVTGDGRLTFHSLRHAFLSWNVLRLAVFDTPALRAYPAAIMAEPGLAPEALSDWMQRWRPAATVAWDGSALQELSRMAGHGSPSTTLRWYTHVADLIVRGTTSLALPAPRRAPLWTLLGEPKLAFKAREGRARRGHPTGMGATHSAWAIQAELAGIPRQPWSTAAPLPTQPRPPLALAQVDWTLRALAMNHDPREIARQLRVDPASVDRMAERVPGMRPWKSLAQAHQALFDDACRAMGPLMDRPQTHKALAYWAQGTLRDHTRLAWDDDDGLPALLDLLGSLLAGVGQGTRLHLELRPLRREGRRPSAAGARRALVRRLQAAGLSNAIVQTGPCCVAFPGTHAGSRGWQGHRIVIRLGRLGAAGFAVERGLMAALDAACLLREPERKAGRARAA